MIALKRIAIILCLVALCGLLLFTVSPKLIAALKDESTTARIETGQSEMDQAQPVLTDVENAQRWGLSTQDWARYRTIMRGPRGLWTPDLDPLTALGVNADNEAERRRYAMILLRLEKERVKRELAFEKTVQAVKTELYPDLEPFDRSRLAAKLVETRQRENALQAGDRALVFVNLQCARCDLWVQELIAKVQAIPNLDLDVYVVGEVTDEAIRSWATRLAIPQALVERGRVTLNHDAGTLVRLTQDPSVTVPVLLRQRGAELAALGREDL
jgi:integrating conjugative element protein (TIGR03759 family)